MSALQLDFPGISPDLSREALILRAERGLHVIASAIVGGGFTHARYIINRHVSKDYDYAHPDGDLRAYAESRGITEPFVGLMTAVYLHNTNSVTLRDGSLTVSAIVTLGLSNAASPGLTRPAAVRPGTINLILLVDGQLTPAAMVGAVITATEVKTQLLLAHKLQTSEGYPATGTSTDAVVVASTNGGERLVYAGPATRVGWLIGRCLRHAIQEALAR